ncbi:MAG TPA: hypothetical protein ENK95_00870 [Campylobacterales bacterium]|nr:hypothetical protein [Campylobacterales bacterium]
MTFLRMNNSVSIPKHKQEGEMENLRWGQVLVLKIVSLFLLMHLSLFANSMEKQISSKSSEKQVSQDQAEVEVETTEVSMTSFGFISVVILVGLSSLLGAYFLRGEFTKSIE